MKHTILITGAAGFIGSHLTRRLLDAGYKVGLLIRSSSDTHRLSSLLNRTSVYEADLCDAGAVMAAVTSFQPEAVCHLASYYVVNHATEDIRKLTDVNVLGTLNLMESAANAGVRHFINTSTAFVYGPSEEPLAEEAPLAPVNLYALTKLHAEEVCTYYARLCDLAATTLRLFPPYGPDDQERKLIPYVVSCLLTDRSPRMTSGQQRWDFTYVGDIADAYLQALRHPTAAGTHAVYNIGTGSAVSVRDAVAALQHIIGTCPDPDWDAVPHRDNEVWHLRADIEKAARELNWQPRTASIEEGLRKTVQWHRSRLGIERGV